MLGSAKNHVETLRADRDLERGSLEPAGHSRVVLCRLLLLTFTLARKLAGFLPHGNPRLVPGLQSTDVGFVSSKCVLNLLDVPKCEAPMLFAMSAATSDRICSLTCLAALGRQHKNAQTGCEGVRIRNPDIGAQNCRPCRPCLNSLRRASRSVHP